MHPNAAECCDANRPGGPRFEYFLPRHSHAITVPYTVIDAALNVIVFAARDARMVVGRVECQQIPNQTPHHANHAGCVEHGTPAPIFDDEAAYWIRQADADAEPLKARHEAAALFRRYPVADDGVHGRPRETRCETLYGTQQYDGTVMVCGRQWNA